MLYSKFFGKTTKGSKDLDSLSASLLTKAGFIDQTMAGVYTYLPMGIRVLTKIEQIVREEMDKIGQEVFMPALAPLSLWETTGRIEAVDVLFKAVAGNKPSKERNDAEYVLNSTHEEVITPIAKRFNRSYKDLPFAVYQIQTKFRNEARPKSGVLRTREFRMKDLYSFHESEADLKAFYEIAQKAYWQVYARLGLKDITYLTLASGGDFTKDYSHEFQTKCEAGEDTLFHAKSQNITFNKEVAPSEVSLPNNITQPKKTSEKTHTPGAITVDQVTKLLNVSSQQLVKTLLFKALDGKFYAVALRADYEVNEVKLERVLSESNLQLASPDDVLKLTGVKVGFVGIVGLPSEVVTVIDDSLKGAVNLITGANETDYHLVNINFGTDLPEPESYVDIKMAKEGDLYPQTHEKYEVFKASEVGNVFPLNTKFSKAFDYNYTTETGEQRPVYMGSYGIGTTRLLGIIAEIFNDSRGLVWPANIAPYTVHLVGLNLEDNETLSKAHGAYTMLQENNIEVLFDDRVNVSAGEKLADADLVGCPVRVVVSKKLEEGLVEIKLRKSEEVKIVKIEELIELAKSL